MEAIVQVVRRGDPGEHPLHPRSFVGQAVWISQVLG
jgi:hypothetical protein